MKEDGQFWPSSFRQSMSVSDEWWKSVTPIIVSLEMKKRGRGMPGHAFSNQIGTLLPARILGEGLASCRIEVYLS